MHYNSHVSIEEGSAGWNSNSLFGRANAARPDGPGVVVTQE